MPTSERFPGSSMNGWSRGTTCVTSSPSMLATLSPLNPSLRATSIVRAAAARGLAAPMLVTMTVPAGRQQRVHSHFEMRIVAARRVDYAVAVAKGDGAFAETFQDHDVEIALFGEIDRGVQPISRKPCSGADAKR